MISGYVIRFGTFEADVTAGELRKHGVKLKLQEQPFRLLVYLIQRPGELVTRDELRAALWPAGTFVDFDRGVATALNKVREALGDSAAKPRFIETVPRRGYRFVGSVETSTAPANASEEVPQAEIRGPSSQWGRVAVASVTALVLLGGVATLVFRLRRPAEPPIRSLVVLPFVNLSGDLSQEYLADGITEALVTELAQLGELRVISRTSALHYKNSTRTAPEIGKELGADAVIEGGAVRSGNRIRITAQLIHSATDRHLWAQSYERDIGDVVRLEGDIARQIFADVGGKLTSLGRARLERPRPVIPAAYEAYARARYLWKKRTSGDFMRALEYFQDAIRIEPDYADAYAGMAECYALGYLPTPRREAAEKARRAAEGALSIDPTVAEAHAALGIVHHIYGIDFPASEAEYRRAIDLNPSYASVHGYYAMLLAEMKRFEEAIAEVERGLAIDPLSLIIATQKGNVFYFQGQYDRAIAQYRKVLELDPGFEVAHGYIARAYEGKGMYAEAVEHFLKRFNAEQAAPLAAKFDAGGWDAFWREWLRIHGKQTARQNNGFLFTAEIYARLGEQERALDALEAAFRERDTLVPQLPVLHTFDGIRSDPRFQELLHEIQTSRTPN